MTRMEALIDLRDKVKAGETPEAHEIVAAIGLNYEEGIACVPLVRWACDPSDIRAMGAAKALHEAVLPGWRWEGYQGECWRVWLRETPKLFYESEDNNPARAWLLAILEALIAQEGEV